VQEDEALDALRVLAAALKCCHLKHLNVSDNALGEKGVRALADAFQHQVGERGRRG
jgi:Ran GTPase-activating protein (RanGAP) involved in mRNA processing and transport